MREFTAVDLRSLITTSGMTITRFAQDIAGVEARTVRRWLSGEISIPPAKHEWLSRILQIRSSDKSAIVRIASKGSVGEILGVLRRN